MLANLTFDFTITSIQRYDYNKFPKITTIVIPSFCSSIDDNIFEDCSLLTSITIPNLVKTIGNSSFKNCSSFTLISLPNSIVTIGDVLHSYKWEFLHQLLKLEFKDLLKNTLN